jgi:hypothetical protein
MLKLHINCVYNINFCYWPVFMNLYVYMEATKTGQILSAFVTIIRTFIFLWFRFIHDDV